MYTFTMAELTERCIAFEANPSQAAKLDKMARLLGKNITVHSVGLSDKDGVAELKILPEDLGRSTIEAANRLPNSLFNKPSSIAIEIKKLDEFRYTDIGFIKIDVEVHEFAVLKGAEKTIKHSLPNLLIEIEDRHNPGSIKRVDNFLQRLGYHGYFMTNNKITPLRDFVASVHQNVKNIGDRSNHYKRFGPYINNFIFISEKKSNNFIHTCHQHLRQI